MNYEETDWLVSRSFFPTEGWLTKARGGVSSPPRSCGTLTKDRQGIRRRRKAAFPRAGRVRLR
jgi:hypothetical protein